MRCQRRPQSPSLRRLRPSKFYLPTAKTLMALTVPANGADKAMKALTYLSFHCWDCRTRKYCVIGPPIEWVTKMTLRLSFLAYASSISALKSTKNLPCSSTIQNLCKFYSSYIVLLLINNLTKYFRLFCAIFKGLLLVIKNLQYLEFFSVYLLHKSLHKMAKKFENTNVEIRKEKKFDFRWKFLMNIEF